MRKRSHKSTTKNLKDLRAGSSQKDAHELGGQGDFGAGESNPTACAYAPQNTRHADPGAAQPRSDSDGLRISGAGGNDSGPGSCSGGDLDPDFIGLGRKGGIAQSVKNEPPAADDVENGSD